LVTRSEIGTNLGDPETELWDRDEILSIVKYEPYKRNKAALTLLWDLDARNHYAT
jgi:integrase/recombinase XerD